MNSDVQPLVTEIQSKLEGIFDVRGIIITVEENKEKTIPEIGIGGFSPDSNQIYVYIDSAHPNIRDNLVQEMKSTIAHEFHHAIRNRVIDWNTDTLLGSMVTEGLADHFDIEINNREPRPWSVALNPEEMESMMKRAQEDFFTTTFNYNDWFFGNTERKIPKWTGYTLGFEIVKKYMEKTGKKASELVAVRPEVFI